MTRYSRHVNATSGVSLGMCCAKCCGENGTHASGGATLAKLATVGWSEAFIPLVICSVNVNQLLK